MAMSSAGPELGEAQRQVAKCACGGLWRQLLLCHSLAAEAAPSRCQDLLLSPYQRLAPPFPGRQVAAEGTEGPLTLSFLLAMQGLSSPSSNISERTKQTQKRAPYPVRLCPALERQERSQGRADG